METIAILHRIADLGYVVQIRRKPAEMFAQQLGNCAVRHIVKLLDPDDAEERYYAACRLAEAVELIFWMDEQAATDTTMV